MQVIIRTDASIEIGIGHVMRCLTLAKQLKRHGAEVTFFCRATEGDLITYLQDEGMKVKTLPFVKNNGIKEWTRKHWLEDANQMLSLLNEEYETIDLLIVDHYSLGIKWERRLKPCVNSIMIIDDLANRSHDCDLLLDQNYYLNMESRYNRLVPSHCIQLLGPDYVLLRDEFLKTKERCRDGHIKKIFVFFGGSDPTGETLKTIQALEKIKDYFFEVHIVVGSSNVLKDEIEKRCQATSDFYYHYQINHIAEVMNESDIAISAGGTTTWERCFLGLPSLTITVADNQIEATKLLGDQGVILYIGQSEEVTPEIIEENVRQLLKNPYRVKEMSIKSSNIINRETVSNDIVVKTIQSITGGER